ncbi:lasso peptide biosynthesis B2 protein [Novosphingobium gossypii]|uniref:lasso peptide biosynthesis B2 protein n=1 Tax=Novosphingobium gossypii TaxID=1604774 RepID=UPI003D2043CC
MANYGMRPGVTFCRIGEQSIFLDIFGDRYFCLQSRLDTAFGDLVERGQIDEHDGTALIDIGILVAEGGGPVRPCPLRADAAPRPNRAEQRKLRPASVAQALLSRVRWTRRVRTKPLAHNIATLSGLQESSAMMDPPVDVLSRIEEAHRHAALLWGTAGRCLPTAMAIMSDLSHGGVAAHLVFGVKLGPFGAHSWVEAQGRPIGEDPENVDRFVPIRIV